MNRGPSAAVGRSLAVFTTEFPPTAVVGALRLGKLCSYLPELGWHPTVFTLSAGAHTIPRDAFTGAQLEPLTYRVPPTVTVQRLAAPNPIVIGSRLRRAGSKTLHGEDRPARPDVSADPSHAWQARIAARITQTVIPDEYVLWIPRAIGAALLAARRRPFDLVWASFPWVSGVLAASWVAGRWGRPMVLDFRDSWASWPPIVRARPWRRAVERRIEDKVFRTVAAATAVNDRMAAEIRSRHPRFGDPVVSLPQGWDPREAAGLESIAPLSRSDGILRLAYGGIVRQAYNPTAFLAALSLLRTRGAIDPARFRVTFFGHQLLDLSTMARQYGLGDMVFTEPHREREKALRDFARSDLLLMIHSDRDPDFISGKIWDYLTAGRHIVLVGHGRSAAADVLLATGAGTVLPYDDVEATADGLAAIWREFDRTGRVPHEPDPAGMARYSMWTVAQTVVSLFEQLVRTVP